MKHLGQSGGAMLFYKDIVVYIVAHLNPESSLYNNVMNCRGAAGTGMLIGQQRSPHMTLYELHINKDYMSQRDDTGKSQLDYLNDDLESLKHEDAEENPLSQYATGLLASLKFTPHKQYDLYGAHNDIFVKPYGMTTVPEFTLPSNDLIIFFRNQMITYFSYFAGDIIDVKTTRDELGISSKRYYNKESTAPGSLGVLAVSEYYDTGHSWSPHISIAKIKQFSSLTSLSALMDEGHCNLETIVPLRGTFSSIEVTVQDGNNIKSYVYPIFV
jgi:hypothetical protein